MPESVIDGLIWRRNSERLSLSTLIGFRISILKSKSTTNRAHNGKNVYKNEYSYSQRLFFAMIVIVGLNGVSMVKFKWLNF